MRGRPIVQLVLLGLVATAIGIAVALLIDWFPAQASAEASAIDTLYDVLLIVSAPIFVLVMAVTIYCVVKFRARPGDTSDGAPIHGNARLEVVWVTIPTLIVTGLMIYTLFVMEDVESAQPEAMVVEVRGEQFAWSFAYPSEDGGPPVQTADLMVPVGRQVEFRIETEDVLHSFFVPAFRIKQDTVPGRTTVTRATPLEEGAYDIVCTELCGIGHSTMRQTVTVMPEEEFDAWLGDQQEALAGEEDVAPADDQSPSGVAAQEPPEEEEGAAPESEAGGGG
jgi:cytochrome c oxidase subunit 2